MMGLKLNYAIKRSPWYKTKIVNSVSPIQIIVKRDTPIQLVMPQLRNNLRDSV